MRYHVGLLLAVLIVVTVTGFSSFAEPTDPNEIGLYLTEDGTGPAGTSTVNTPVYVYLVLTKPRQLNGEPMSTITAFECMMEFSQPLSWVTLVPMAYWYPQWCVNYGDAYNSWDLGQIEFNVQYNTPVEPINDAAVLVEIQFMNFTYEIFEVTLRPLAESSVPGEMIVVANGETIVMEPVSGSPNAPVFVFNGEAVDIESTSFGSVKALFRN